MRPILTDRSPPARSLCSVIARTLDDGPTFVAFSGGCDSSLILSAATQVCRASGRADPVPVTHRFAQAPETDEREYQELVVRHLGLRDWIVIDVDEDADLLGPPATEALRTNGLVWPPALTTDGAALRQLDDGLLLTGEGGDELLGWRRITPIADVARSVRHRRNPSLSYIRDALEGLAPRPLRKAILSRQLERHYGASWLSPDVRGELLGRVATLKAAEPLGARAFFQYNLARPAVRIGHHNARAFHAQFGMRWEAPLYDPAFLSSLAGVRWYDYRGRTQMLRRHFSALLPPEIVERRTKATFNRAFFGRRTREFARRWAGTGLPDGVDPDWLKHHWSTATDVHTGTSTLLHYAWLATEGAPKATSHPEPISSSAQRDQGLL